MKKFDLSTRTDVAPSPLRLSMEVLVVVTSFLTFALLLGFAANGIG